MDVKVSIAAIKDAITKSAAERTSPEVISAAYAVVHLIGVCCLRRRAFSAQQGHSAWLRWRRRVQG